MKAFMKTVSIFSLVGTLAFVFAASSPATAADTIKLGIIYALSGPGSALGTKQMEGAKLAVEEINKAGGARFGDKRLKIEPFYHDTETKPDAAIRKMKSMINDNQITALVGGTFAHVSLAMNDQCRRTPIMYCATNGVPEEFFEKSKRGPYSFSPMVTNESIGRASAAYITEVMKLKKIAVCLPDYAYGHGALRGVEEIFQKNPVEWQKIMTPVGTADMTPYLIRVSDAKPEIVSMGQWGNDAINILKQAYDLNLRGKMKLFFNWIVNVFATGIPPDALENVMCQMYWYHDMSGFGDAEVVKSSNEFTERYRAAYGEPPDPYAMSAYYGVKETIRGMELAKSTDPAKAYAALMANPDWVSAKGPAKWRIDGQAAHKYFSFIGKGLGSKERKDQKWDYVKIMDGYKGTIFQKDPSQLGW
jgi:branched-chain amino acid transport system substrate-binding protein